MCTPADAAAAADDDQDSLLPVVRRRLYDLRLTTQRRFQEPRDKLEDDESVAVVEAATSAHQYSTQCYSSYNTTLKFIVLLVQHCARVILLTIS